MSLMKTGIMKIPSALRLVATETAFMVAAPSFTDKMMFLATLEVRFELLSVLLHSVKPVQGLEPILGGGDVANKFNLETVTRDVFNGLLSTAGGPYSTTPERKSTLFAVALSSS